MNWPYIFRCVTFGLLFGLYAAGMAVMSADAWPTAFAWLKIGAGSLVALVIGIFTYARDPDAAWKAGPGGKG